MFFKKYLALTTVVLLSGCELTSDSWVYEEPAEQDQSPATITALYNTPLEDANIAVAVKDFRVLAFANKSTTAPGIPSNYKLTQLEQRCGLRFLPGTGNVIDGSYDARQQKKIFDYAINYNKVILAACEKYFGKINR